MTLENLTPAVRRESQSPASKTSAVGIETSKLSTVAGLSKTNLRGAVKRTLAIVVSGMSESWRLKSGSVVMLVVIWFGRLVRCVVQLRRT